MNKKLPLNATALRILAMVLMLMDHMWATVIPGNDWMTYLGRLAFPIFAFQAAEGYLHTHDFKRYCRRLLVSKVYLNDSDILFGFRYLDLFEEVNPL